MGVNSDRRDQSITRLMTRDFRTRRADAPETAEPGGIVVLLDDLDTPVAVLGSDGPGPAVVVPAAASTAEVLHSEEVLDALLDGAPALVVIDEESRPLGVVPALTVREQLTRAIGAPRELGDADPYPDRTRFPPLVRVRCASCGGTNVFARVSQVGTSPCQHGDHDFIADYGGH